MKKSLLFALVALWTVLGDRSSHPAALDPDLDGGSFMPAKHFLTSLSIFCVAVLSASPQPAVAQQATAWLYAFQVSSLDDGSSVDDGDRSPGRLAKQRDPRPSASSRNGW